MSKSLTLGKLSEYDDILTDHLIDKIYYWIKTHKANTHKRYPSQATKTEQVVSILQDHVIPSGGKLAGALKAFLRLGTIQPFYKELDISQRKDFQRHLRKYLSIYLPRAGFEICSTDRYPGSKAESCIIANKNYRAGEVINCLAGTIVAMTEEEEDYYEGGHDFSIIHSSRLDAMCLFLGPARFVNHDCDPNGAFVTQDGAIAITTIKSIPLGDEITVFYSPDYFGPGNADCLCETCEKNSSGGYRPQTAQNLSDPQSNSEGPIKSSAMMSKPAKKRNHVQTIEVEARSLARPAKKQRTSINLITPPSSEMGDDLTRTIDCSDTDSLHVIYISDSGEENDFLQTADLNGKIITEILEDEIETVKALPAEHDMDEEHSDDPVIRRLRPRRLIRDYNLKRRSWLSLVPVAENEDALSMKPRQKRKIGSKYCAVCDEEVIGDTIVPNRSSTETPVLSKNGRCRRCERHSKLYKDSWPKRTSIGLRKSALRHVSSPSQVIERQKSLSEGGLQRSSSQSTQDSSASDIESAKIRLKQGKMSIPRLQSSLHVPHTHQSDATRVETIENSRKDKHETLAELEREQQPSSSHIKASPSKTTPVLTRCVNCRELFCRCMYDPLPTMRKIAQAKVTKSPIKQKSTAKMLTDSTPISPDSEIAARQVQTNGHAAQEPDDIYSFESMEESEASTGKAFPAFKKQRRLSPDSLRVDRATLGRKITKTAVDVAVHGTSNDGETLGSSAQSRESSLAKKRRSTGSCFYVEVNSSEEEEEDVILSSRLRSQGTTKQEPK